MLITDLSVIGSRAYTLRKKSGMTQEAVAELADISSRAYADFERGMSNIRLETMIKICTALKITPDVLLTDCEDNDDLATDEIAAAINDCPSHERNTAIRLLSTYLNSLKSSSVRKQ